MFILLAVSTLLIWLTVRQYQKASRLPPGPLSFPLIGNLPQIIFYSWKTGGIVPTLDVFRKKYGNIFTLWLGPLPHVNIADYDTAQEVFVKNGSKYADKFTAPIFHDLRKGLGVTFTNGEHWQEIRRFALQTFRDMGVGKDQMEIRIMEELDARCAEIDKNAKNGVTVQQAAMFFDLVIGSIINSFLVGYRFEEHNKGEFFEIKKVMDASMEAFAPFDLTAPVWMLKRFFKRRYALMADLQKNIARFTADKAVKRVTEIENGDYVVTEGDPKDFTDAFILKMQAEKMKDGENHIFTKDNLEATIIDLWFAGQETTSTTLVSGFNQLLLQPNIMEKARDELMKVTDGGSRNLSLSDRPSTPYYNALLAEVQRHASVLNVNFWRYNHEFTYMGGQPVDGGVLVAAQLSALHVNEDVFENPGLFDPERYLRDEKLLQKVIPFGVGKRSCLGESMARAELYLIFGNLLLRYEFKANGKLSSEEILPFSAAKRPFKLEMQFIKLH